MLLMGLLAPLANAQVLAPSQATPPTLRPPPPPPAGSAIPEIEAAQPHRDGTPLTTMNVQVANIVVENGFDEMTRATEQLLEEYTRRRINGEDIFNLAAAIEQAYVHAGFLLARITMLPQTVADGSVLRFRLVDGTIEAIDVDQVPARVRRLVARRVSPLIGRHAIRARDLEHYLLLAGNVAGVQLRSVLVAGHAPGTSRLILTATHKVYAGSVSVDDRLSGTQGPWEAALSCSASSLLGWGEQVYGFVSGARPNLPAQFGHALGVAGGGFVLPLLDEGLAVNPEYTYSRTRSDAQPQVPATSGTFERLALRLTQPLVIARARNDDISLSVESLRQSLTLPQFGVALNADQYRAARAQWTQQVRFATGLVESASLTLSHGLGGRSAKDVAASGVPLSRLGAQDDFSTVAGRLELLQPAGALLLQVTGAGQAAFRKPVYRSEQFALEGPEAISAFAPGSLPVDQGSTVRGQLEYPWSNGIRSGLGTVTPYLMVAHGVGDINNPTGTEPRAVHANAWGAGAVAGWSHPESGRGAQLQLEVAHGTSTLPAIKDAFRVHASLVIRF